MQSRSLSMNLSVYLQHAFWFSHPSIQAKVLHRSIFLQVDLIHSQLLSIDHSNLVFLQMLLIPFAMNSLSNFHAQILAYSKITLTFYCFLPDPRLSSSVCFLISTFLSSIPQIKFLIKNLLIKNLWSDPKAFLHKHFMLNQTLASIN